MENYKDWTTDQIWWEFNAISVWDAAEMEEFLCRIKGINPDLAKEMLDQCEKWKNNQRLKDEEGINNIHTNNEN